MSRPSRLARMRFERSAEYKIAKAAVWRRDGAQCQRCGAHSRDTKLHIHHIVAYHKAPKLRAAVTNLVLLCKVCHSFVHSAANVRGLYIR